MSERGRTHRTADYHPHVSRMWTRDRARLSHQTPAAAQKPPTPKPRPRAHSPRNGTTQRRRDSGGAPPSHTPHGQDWGNGWMHVGRGFAVR
jgi:hypothetical protein